VDPSRNDCWAQRNRSGPGDTDCVPDQAAHLTAEFYFKFKSGVPALRAPALNRDPPSLDAVSLP